MPDITFTGPGAGTYVAKDIGNSQNAIATASKFVDQLFGEDNSKIPANGVPTGGGSIVVRGGIFSDSFALPTIIGNEVITTGSLACYGSKKVVWVVVTTLLTYGASGQATIQFYASRVAVAATGVATSTATRITAPNNMASLGAAQNLGASTTTLPVGHYRFGPETAAIAGLNSPDLQIGCEIIFPGGNIASGVFTVELEHGTT